MADITDGGPMNEIERIIFMSEEGGQRRYHPRQDHKYTSKESNAPRYKKADQ